MDFGIQESLDNLIEPVNTSWATIVLTILSLMLVQQISQRVIGRIVDRAIAQHKYTSAKERKKRRDTIVAVFNSMITVLVIIIGIVVLLHQFGINITALVAGFGALGVVLGVAGQDVIKDFFRGVSIIMYDQYRVGDIVTIAGYSGVVEALSLRFTRLRDLDGNVHIVPNGAVSIVTNQSLGYSSVNLNVGVSYDTDIELVEKVINETGQKMAEEEQWQAVITEPIAFLRVDNFGDSSIKIKALGRVMPGEQWATAGEFRRRLKKSFEKNGIEIPFKQIVIHSNDKPKKS